MTLPLEVYGKCVLQNGLCLTISNVSKNGLWQTIILNTVAYSGRFWWDEALTNQDGTNFDDRFIINIVQNLNGYAAYIGKFSSIY